MTRCPACKTTYFSVKTLIPSVLTVRQCKACGLYLSTFLKREHGGYEIIDDFHYQKSIALSRRIQSKDIVKEALRFVPSKAKWLDIGCGVGILLKEAKNSGFTVIGVDPDPKAVAQANHLLGKRHVQKGIMRESTVPNHSMDIVSTTDLLEHIPENDVSGFLRMVRLKLKTDGIYIIKIPSSDGLYFKITHFLAKISQGLLLSGIQRMWLVHYEYPHTLYVNENSLTKLLSQNGFQVIHLSYLNEIPNKSIFDRIRMDKLIPVPLAVAAVPIFYAINFIEHLRRKSDSLLVFARPE